MAPELSRQKNEASVPTVSRQAEVSPKSTIAPKTRSDAIEDTFQSNSFSSELRVVEVEATEKGGSAVKGLKTILYATTSLERAEGILASGGIIPSRLGTALADKAIETMTGANQTTARSLTQLDYELDRQLSASGGAWLRVWGSLKRPSEMSPLEFKLMGAKTAPEVTIAFEVDAAQLKKPEPWKSTFTQPSVRYVPTGTSIPLAQIKELIAYSRENKEKLQILSSQCAPHVSVSKETVSENATKGDALRFLARPGAYAACATYALALGPAMAHFGLDSWANQAAIFASGVAVLSVMFTIPNVPLINNAGKAFLGSLKELLKDESTGALPVAPVGLSEIKGMATRAVTRLFFGRNVV